MKHKLEPKLKQKKLSRTRKQDHQAGKSFGDKQCEISYKKQQSALVKEKIKEILEDGQKKTFITLIPRQESDLNREVFENRISVIRSVSSLFDEQKQFQFNDEHENTHM